MEVNEFLEFSNNHIGFLICITKPPDKMIILVVDATKHILLVLIEIALLRQFE